MALKGDFFFFAICEKAMFMLHIFLKKVEYIMLFFKMIFYRMKADVSSFEEVYSGKVVSHVDG